jgi:cell wall-associated NlpC family hydrolase
VLVSAALVAGSAIPSASAASVSNDQAKAQALTNQINALGNKEAALGEQYDATVLASQATSSQIKQQEAQVAAANAHAAVARTAVQADAIDAYVNGGTLVTVASRNGVIDAADGGLLANEYVSTLASTQDNNMDNYANTAETAQIATNQLQALQKQQTNEAAATRQARNAVSAAQSQLVGTLASVKSELQALLAQAQQAKQEAAARADSALLLEAQSITGGVSAGGPRSTAPIPTGSGAAEAVAAAESRLGDPYVWGGAGPNVFDCSGLVMWAWAHAGVSLPHFSGAQYASVTHISMSQLQPGDLVFFSDTGEHVAMYIGGGNIIEAPHTGAWVHIVPLYSEFTLAGRP